MKSYLFLFFAFTTCISFSQSTESHLSPLKGTWALIYGEYADTTRQGEIFQYRIFDDKYFTFLMKDASGGWNWGVIGTYDFDGNTYTEKFLHDSQGYFTAVRATWEYSIKGDSLFTHGPLKIWDKDGNDNNPELTRLVGTMKETRIRLH
ncbi:MAG: hypothetical protein OEM26_05080 [Saprospiraceae bacterium]|nr:hypothetical protein [Saprospiraceae bacterium]